ERPPRVAAERRHRQPGRSARARSARYHDRSAVPPGNPTNRSRTPWVVAQPTMPSTGAGCQIHMARGAEAAKAGDDTSTAVIPKIIARRTRTKRGTPHSGRTSARDDRRPRAPLSKAARRHENTLGARDLPARIKARVRGSTGHD